MDNWVVVFLLAVVAICVSFYIGDLNRRLRRIENAFADAVKQLEAA